MEIRDLAVFLRYFENIRSRTLRVIGEVPPESIDWRPAPDTFSFADVVRHLGAMERWMFAENVAGRPSRYAGHGPDLAEGYDGVVGYLERMHADSMAIFSRLDAADLERPCTTPGGATMAVWKWLRAMIEHEVHHRGQIFLMSRLLGAPTTPLYGITSEEVLRRSVGDQP